MGLFANLYVGNSGLQSSQEALNVVAHNVTNADTTGYTRQQVSYGTREYSRLSNSNIGVAVKQAGLGVYISEVRQVRDRFVDASYRNQAGRQGFYDASYAAIEEIEEIFGELDGPTFENAMNSLQTSLAELAKEPTSEVKQSMVIQYAQSFVEASQNAYRDMSNYQDKLNLKVQTTVDEINALGHEIYSLNQKIRVIATGGVENPNDLYDQRNLALDKLGALINISYQEDFFGNVLVKAENHDFVTMNGVNEMGYQAEDDDSVGEPGFYNVFWTDSATVESRDEHGNIIKYVQDTVRNNPNTGKTASGAVYDWTLDISSKLDTDVGTLKGVLLARGDHRGNFYDLESEDSYDRVADSVMMNIMAEFDGLVHNVVTAMNQVLQDAAATVDPAFGYLRDENGNTIQIFERISSEEYRPDGTYIAEDKNDNMTWFTTPNLVVNADLLQYPTHLGLKLPDASEDGGNDTAEKLRDVFQNEDYLLNPTLTNKTSLRRYYANFVAQIANSGNVYQNLKDNQDLTVESIEANRQGSIGVATDEELANMIKFQNAYNASSRFINVIDECIEHIINTLGA
ncbi:MAG: flagellar hook-associated protein FlgK [Lachnospiraceae bacterium]|nr:flagellar hook-associated protein FlgK [Lachnospiraceae bacterium]